MPYRFQNMNVRSNDNALVRVPRLKDNCLEPVPQNVCYPRTKGELSQLDCTFCSASRFLLMLIHQTGTSVAAVRHLLKWYGIDDGPISPKYTEQHRMALAGYLGVALLA